MWGSAFAMGACAWTAAMFRWVVSVKVTSHMNSKTQGFPSRTLHCNGIIDVINYHQSLVLMLALIGVSTYNVIIRHCFNNLQCLENIFVVHQNVSCASSCPLMTSSLYKVTYCIKMFSQSYAAEVPACCFQKKEVFFVCL